MFTLDKSRKVITKKSLTFSVGGLHPVEGNGNGIFILQEGDKEVFWMSVPGKKGAKLYPMKKGV